MLYSVNAEPSLLHPTLNRFPIITSLGLNNLYLADSMRESRQSRQNSVLVASEKVKYPRCERKKEHHKESLNLVCLSPQCKLRGLCCLQCKTTEHHGHLVQPLRTFLNKLEDSLKRLELNRAPKMSENIVNDDPSTLLASQDSLNLLASLNASTVVANERSILERLEDQHLEMLAVLKIEVEEMAQKVRICEEDVMKEFNQVKEKVFTEFQKETIINKTMAEVQRFFAEAGKVEAGPEDGASLKLNISKLLSLLKIDKNDFVFTNEADKNLNAYALSAKTFHSNMLAWERETNNILTEIFKAKPEYQLKEVHHRPTTAIDSTTKSPALAFSLQYRTQSVVLDKEGRNARVKDDKQGKVVLLNQPVLEHKGTSVRVKITSQTAASAIQFGLCLKTHLSQKMFKFDKSNANHGLFVASSNGFVYSSGDQQCNGTKGHPVFKAGDEIIIEVDSKESRLVVKKKNDSKSADISLKHLSAADWKELYFCVGMNSVGDKIQLLG